jgi:hypothetical protein
VSDDDDERINKVKNEIKLLLYNKRNLIVDIQDDISMGPKKTIKIVKKVSKRAPKEDEPDKDN